MANSETMVKIKKAIRRSHSKLDEDLMDDIDACIADLKAVGVTGPNAVESDPLFYNAIKLYCKSLNTDDTAKAAEWLRRYESLKACLMMAKGYRGEATADG